MVTAGILGILSAVLVPSAELAMGVLTVYLLFAVAATIWYARKVYQGEKKKEV